MAKILVYNNDDNKMETYFRSENESMPYNTNSTLKVKEFRGSSNSNILWTTKNTMRAWNSTRYLYGSPIPVGFAFKRSWEGGHSGQSQHYAGVAFDVGQTLSNTQRNNIRNIAISSGVWSYVEPGSLTPTWVHFDKRQYPSACTSGGYPLIRQGSKRSLCISCTRWIKYFRIWNWWIRWNFRFADEKCCNGISTKKRPSSRWYCRM